MSAIDTKVPNVDECGYKAYKEGFRNFALQSPGQCWGSNVEDYDREGGARTCSHDQDDYARDMGGPWSNAVYTFGGIHALHNALRGTPACDLLCNFQSFR